MSKTAQKGGLNWIWLCVGASKSIHICRQNSKKVYIYVYRCADFVYKYVDFFSLNYTFILAKK